MVLLLTSFTSLNKIIEDHYRKVMGRKAWRIGPLSVCNKDTEDKAQRERRDEREIIE